MPDDIVERLTDWTSRHSNVTPLDGTDRDSPTFGDLRALLSALKEREEALDDCLATMAAVRATSVSPDDWANSAQHLHDICGESMSKARASLNREKDA